jgi:phosphoribosyl-ATP pyrophosphohydrolase
MGEGTLDRLAALVSSRRTENSDKSYTRQLLDAGPKRCAKKFGEEAAEAVIAAVAEDGEALTNEAADVLYHLVVLLESRDISLAEVMQVLEKRMGQSGLAEKASRGQAKS